MGALPARVVVWPNKKRVDYVKLTQELTAGNQLFRAYYYHCLPYQSNPPTEEERRRYGKMHGFITAIKRMPRFEVRLGRIARLGINAEGKPITCQKRVDCMMGVDMALLAGKRVITDLAIITGDSDLIPAIEAVKSEAVIVTLWHGSYSAECRPSGDLVHICDECQELTSDVITRIQRV
jgi:uncharacterized LabA/DUF88 family protein